MRARLLLALLAMAGCAHDLDQGDACAAIAPKGKAVAGWIVRADGRDPICLYFHARRDRYRRSWPRPYDERPELPTP